MDKISDILKSARERLNLSIDDLSEQTKIRPNIIESIENNDLANFQSVYLKAYIRNLAKELQIENNSEFLSAYDEFLKELKEEKSNSTTVKKISISDFEEYQTNSQAKKNDKIFRSSPVLNTNLLIYSGIIIFIIVILIITFSPFRKSVTNDSEHKPPENSETSSLLIKNNNDESLIDYFKSSDSLLLKANVSDSVWINITIDSAVRVNTILLPNKEYEWKAGKSFVITHGNAGNIKFYLNSQALEPFAKPGYIAKNVRITREGVFVSPQDTVSKIRRKKRDDNSSQQIRSIEPTEIEEVKPKLK